MPRTALPQLPIEADPIAVDRDLEVDQLRALLDEALAGIPPGAYDQRMVNWLKTTDQPTVVSTASLILRARQQGTGPGGGTD